MFGKKDRVGGSYEYDAHKIPFATKFKYRKDFPLKANIWNLYSYFRFLYTRKIVLEK